MAHKKGELKNLNELMNIPDTRPKNGKSNNGSNLTNKTSKDTNAQQDTQLNRLSKSKKNKNRKNRKYNESNQNKLGSKEEAKIVPKSNRLDTADTQNNKEINYQDIKPQWIEVVSPAKKNKQNSNSCSNSSSNSSSHHNNYNIKKENVYTIKKNEPLPKQNEYYLHKRLKTSSRTKNELNTKVLKFDVSKTKLLDDYDWGSEFSV